MLEPALVPVQITYQPMDRLITRVHAALASMRNTLRSLEDCSFHERSRLVPEGYPVFLDLKTNVTDAEIAQNAIRDAFQAIVRALVDYVDLLHGIQGLIDATFTDSKPLHSLVELESFIAAEIESRTLKVAGNTSRNSHEKVTSLGALDQDGVMKAVKGYYSIRADLEHHKCIARKGRVLHTLRVAQTEDDLTASTLLLVVRMGDQVQEHHLVDQTHRFAEGDEIILSEIEVDQLVTTIITHIGPALFKQIAPPAPDAQTSSLSH